MEGLSLLGLVGLVGLVGFIGLPYLHPPLYIQGKTLSGAEYSLQDGYAQKFADPKKIPVRLFVPDTKKSFSLEHQLSTVSGNLSTIRGWDLDARDAGSLFTGAHHHVSDR